MAQTKQENQNIFRLEDSFSTFAVKDVEAAKTFYGETLGFEIEDQKEGGFSLTLGGQSVYVYPKPDHEPATFTVFNLAVSDIDAAVDELRGRGVEFESYTGEMETDDKGIFHGAETGGPNIAWFKDPSGNILSAIEME